MERIDIRVFEPIRKDELDKYGVVIPCEGKMLGIIEKCPSLEQLRSAYKDWYDHSVRGGLVKPLPVEFLDSKGTCKILTDMIIDPNNN